MGGSLALKRARRGPHPGEFIHVCGMSLSSTKWHCLANRLCRYFSREHWEAQVFTESFLFNRVYIRKIRHTRWQFSRGYAVPPPSFSPFQCQRFRVFLLFLLSSVSIFWDPESIGGELFLFGFVVTYLRCMLQLFLFFIFIFRCRYEENVLTGESDYCRVTTAFLHRVFFPHNRYTIGGFIGRINFIYADLQRLTTLSSFLFVLVLVLFSRAQMLFNDCPMSVCLMYI